MPTKFISMNRHTLEVYASLEAEDESAAKEIWAQKCGCETFTEFAKKLSIPLEDIEFNAVTDARPPEILDRVTFISHATTYKDEWVFFVLIGDGQERYWEYLAIPTNLGEPLRHQPLDTHDEMSLSFLRSSLRTWRDVPPEIQKIVEDIVS